MSLYVKDIFRFNRTTIQIRGNKNIIKKTAVIYPQSLVNEDLLMSLLFGGKRKMIIPLHSKKYLITRARKTQQSNVTIFLKTI